ncbi:uncharacterized protein LOC121525192 [Cheilinus undulatus]|uniref:uncharacterized protein LOC121525192 n=1 Tax=Cheilinus undulatus TaxID=241271 RepID=UPI001BD33879|nr:uncharacterized protein LOC121525192 [Cheilinus undulatus]
MTSISEGELLEQDLHDAELSRRESNDPSKYDYIKFKELIHSGSPTVFKLTPKTEYIGNIKKVVLGEQNPDKTKRTILLVGETGTGKSTLINALVNYAIGVTWEDNVWFEIVEKEKKREQCESQTSDVIVYEIFGFEGKTVPYSLTIIDTPGYGDTRGIEKDNIVRQRLSDLFRSDKGVYELNAVGLVLKAADNRLSNRLRYIFDSVVSLFGKDMEDSIFPLVTHSDGGKPTLALEALKEANIKIVNDENNQPVYFLFNNCQTDERNENKDALKNSWDLTSRGMKKFTGFLRQLLPKNLKATAEVLNSRISLTASINNLKDRVRLVELKQEVIQKTEEALREYEQEKESNKNFTVEVDEPYKEKTEIKGGMWGLVFYEGAVCCNKCEENCHYPGCTVAWYPRDCEVMKKGRCTSCSRKCPVSDHVKKREAYEIKTRKVTMTLQDIEEKFQRCKPDSQETTNTSEVRKEKCEGSEEDHKKAEKFLGTLQISKATLQDRKKKYDESEEGSKEKTSLLGTLEREMEDLQRDKDHFLRECYDHVEKLEKTALNVDSLSTLDHLDYLIMKMKESGESPDNDKFKNEVKALEDMKSRALSNEGTKAALKYKQATK